MRLDEILRPVLVQCLDAAKPFKKGLPKRKLGVRFPTAYAVSYQKWIAAYIKNLEGIITKWIDDDLFPVLILHAQERGDSWGYEKNLVMCADDYFETLKHWRLNAISDEEFFRRTEFCVPSEQILKTDSLSSDRARYLKPAIFPWRKMRGDTVDDIGQKLDDLMTHFSAVLAEEAIRQEIYENAHQMLSYAHRSWKRTIHTITNVDPLINHAMFEEYVQAHVRENVKLIKTIPAKLHADVERVVWTGVRKGQSLKEIEKGIQEVYPVTRKRAGVIARDQCGSFNAAIVDEQYGQANLTTYIWGDMRDRRVRGNPGGKYPNAIPSHWARNGMVCSVEDPPEGGHPGEATCCRCYRRVQEAELKGDTENMLQPGQNYDTIAG